MEYGPLKQNGQRHTLRFQDLCCIGEGLARARDIFRHDKDGGFDGWLKKEFNESRRSAYRYICFFENFENSTVTRVSQLNGISQKALFEMSAPSTPDEVRQTAIEMAEAGNAPTEKIIKELKAKNKELNDLIQKQREAKSQDINNLIPKLKELLDSESISESVALAYSQLPVEVHIEKGSGSAWGVEISGV